MRKCVLIVSALSTLALAGAAWADTFNPQPDPPGRSRSHVLHHPHDRASSRVHAFNPQPDPPGDKHVPHTHTSTGSQSRDRP